MLRSDRGFTRWPVTLVHTCISWHYARGLVWEDVSSRYVCTTNEIHFWGYTTPFLAPHLSVQVWVQHMRTFTVQTVFVFCGKPVSKDLSCAWRIYLAVNFLKANHEGCLPAVQPALNLFVSPAKVHLFKATTAPTEFLQLYLQSCCAMFVCLTQVELQTKKSLNLMSVKWVKHSQAQKVTVSYAFCFFSHR